MHDLNGQRREDNVDTENILSNVMMSECSTFHWGTCQKLLSEACIDSACIYSTVLQSGATCLHMHPEGAVSEIIPLNKVLSAWNAFFPPVVESVNDMLECESSLRRSAVWLFDQD